VVAVPLVAAEGQELECLIEPKVTVSVSTPVEGVIEKVLVERGDPVKRGQLLVELESAVERAGVERARVSLEFAERESKRNEELNRTNVISVQDLDEAQSTEELARVELQRARAALAQRRIRSPVDGVVVRRHHSPGEYADTRPILEIAQVDPLHVEVFAPVSSLGSIRPGMTARVTPEGPLDRSYEATVTVVDPVVDAASATFGVRLELPNPDHALSAGLGCRVLFPTDPAPAVAPAPPDDGSGSLPDPRLPTVDASDPEVPVPLPEGGVEGLPEAPGPEVFGPPASPHRRVATAEAVEPESTPPEDLERPEPAVPVEPKPPVPAATPAQRPDPVGRVVRATFTSGVTKREPVDSVETFPNDRDRVLFFTELHGMQGQTVTHRWEFNGRVVAEVPFEVRGWRWRVYSSKGLLPGQLGEWRVSVVDPAGRPLLTDTFRYVAADPTSSPSATVAP
jgi:RND family efflux transporter MFP subunit